MAITFVAAGTHAAGTTSITPALPSGVGAGHLMLLVVHTANNAISSVTGWTQVTNSPVTVGTASTAGGVGLHVFYRWWQSGDAAPTVTPTSGTVTNGRIYAFSGVDPTTPFDATPVAGTKGTASTSVSFPSITTVTANAWIVLCSALDLDANNSDTIATALTNANLTSITERQDQTVNTATGGGTYVATGIKGTTGSTGATTGTITSTIQLYLTIALRPQATTPATTSPTGRSATSSFTNPTSIGKAKGSPAGTIANGTINNQTLKGKGLGYSSSLISNLSLGTSVGKETGTGIVSGKISNISLGSSVSKGKSTVVISGLSSISSLGISVGDGGSAITIPGIANPLGLYSFSELGAFYSDGYLRDENGELILDENSQPISDGIGVVNIAFGKGYKLVSGISSSIYVGSSSGNGKGLKTTTGVNSTSTLGTSVSKGKGTKVVGGVNSTFTLGTTISKGKGLKIPIGVNSASTLGISTASHVLTSATSYPSGISLSSSLGSCIVKGRGIKIVNGSYVTSTFGTSTASHSVPNSIGNAVISGLPSLISIGISIGKGKGYKLVDEYATIASIGAATAYHSSTGSTQGIATPLGLASYISSSSDGTLRDENGDPILDENGLPISDGTSSLSTVTGKGRVDSYGSYASSYVGTSSGKGKGLKVTTGVNSTSTLGTSTASHFVSYAIVTPSGVNSNITEGSSTGLGKGLKVATGVSGTTVIGTPVEKAKATALVSSVSSQTSFGNIATVGGKGRKIVGGVNVTSSIGSCTFKCKATFTTPGVSSTTSVGNEIGKGKGKATPLGKVVTSSLGTSVSISIATVTGKQLTSSVGYPIVAKGKASAAILEGVSTGNAGYLIPLGSKSKVYYDSRQRVTKIVKTITQGV